MSLAAKAGLYWHTLRYLKPVQFYGRLWFRFAKPKPFLAPAGVPRVPEGNWVEVARRRRSLVGPGDFVFLGESGSLAQIGWDGSQREKLWRYNQHYFDDLNAVEADERIQWHRHLLERWTLENPPGRGTGWEPYPTSLRIVNWLKWALAGNPLPKQCEQSLAVQARWLSKRLEWHLLGNHLFANAKALVFAGLAFSGQEGARWLHRGLRIIDRELPEQVLPDGGNFERSTMYHAIFLEDVLDLINAAQAWPGCIDESRIRQWRAVAGRMLGWLVGMTHPDGEIALFNDAAFGIAPAPGNLLAYADRLGITFDSDFSEPLGPLAVYRWPDSGYLRLAAPDAVALLDVAPVGPDYLPGHAHADTLSFELSLFGRRVVVNGGTSRYGLGPERLRERETASHSTVELDGRSSSEVWGGFRVARRAYPFGLAGHAAGQSLRVQCSHNGYERLPGKPVHRREWQLEDGCLAVNDVIDGPCGKAVARYIFHPDIGIREVSSDAWRLVLVTGEEVDVLVDSGVARLEAARYAPEFGKVLKTMSLVVELQDGKASVRFRWGRFAYSVLN